MQDIQEQHRHRGGWLRDVVFGLNDGLVTTLVFILAVQAVAASQLVPVVLGEMFAGAASMGLGAFLSARTEIEILLRRIATERYEIMNEPTEERAELRQIYFEKGFRGALLDRVVEYLVADRGRWLNAMVRDELGLVPTEDVRPPWLQAALVATSFMAGAVIPLLPFLLRLPSPQYWTAALAALTACGLGVVKARYTLTGPLKGGLEFLGVVVVGTGIGLAVNLILSAIARPG